VLDGARMAETFGLAPPDWRIGLTRTLAAWQAEAAERPPP
jgi:hypothetical protein